MPAVSASVMPVVMVVLPPAVPITGAPATAEAELLLCARHPSEV
ncbi:hypothetical protein DHODJN_09615 [Methylorubrum extorquens]